MEFPPSHLKSSRLILRRPVIEDASAIFEIYAQDPEVTKYLTWQPHKSVKETTLFLQRCEKVWKKGNAFPWTILRKTDDQIMGMIEVQFEQNAAILGFVLGRPFWGKSYMPEAMNSVISWCFGQDNLYRIWAVCDTENKSSARAMEKAGMQKEGILRRWVILPQQGTLPRDCFVYSIVK